MATVALLIETPPPGTGLKLNVPPVSPVIVEEAVVHPVDAAVKAGLEAPATPFYAKVAPVEPPRLSQLYCDTST